jgi:dienelactone hydrolase
VGIVRCTFIDSTRSVFDYATTPPSVRSSHRTLLTEIRYPISAVTGGPNETPGAAPLARGGGYPVIVFAHGYDVSPDTYAALLDDWARAGFVVVAPFFPDEKFSAVTAQNGADTEGDLANEPGDVAFVTRQVLQSSNHASPSCPVLHGLVNPSHIALAGQSDGANAVATLAYNQGLDPQGVSYASLDSGLNIQAILILSGQEAPAQTYAAPAGSPPLLMVQSVQDQCNSIRSAVTLYRDVHRDNKWFLELQTAHHLPPYDGIDKPAFRVVVGTTVHFLATTLQVAKLSMSLLNYGNRTPTVAQMFNNQAGPSLTNLPPFTGVCGLT